MENQLNSKSEIEIKSKELLLRLGITPDLAGYQCAAAAITELFYSKQRVSHCKLYQNKKKSVSTCNLYQKCADELQMSRSAFERAIRYTIISRFKDKNKLEHFEDVIKCKITDKLTVSSFLSLCVERLFINEKEESEFMRVWES